MLMKTFKFGAVVNFEITVAEASQILATGDSGRSMADWLGKHLPCPDSSEGYCERQMKESLGQHLAEQRIDEARQITMPVESTVTPEKE